MFRSLVVAVAGLATAAILGVGSAVAQSYDFGNSNIPSGLFYCVPGFFALY
jgi:hypothetical protein